MRSALLSRTRTNSPHVHCLQRIFFTHSPVILKLSHSTVGSDRQRSDCVGAFYWNSTEFRVILVISPNFYSRTHSKPTKGTEQLTRRVKHPNKSSQEITEALLTDVVAGSSIVSRSRKCARNCSITARAETNSRIQAQSLPHQTRAINLTEIVNKLSERKNATRLETDRRLAVAIL